MLIQNIYGLRGRHPMVIAWKQDKKSTFPSYIGLDGEREVNFVTKSVTLDSGHVVQPLFLFARSNSEKIPNACANVY